MSLTPTEDDIRCGFNGTLFQRDDVLLIPGHDGHRRMRQIIDPKNKEVLYWDGALTQQPMSQLPVAELDTPPRHMPGRYVFGGYIRVHFGHFLIECISPLWALDHADGPIDGILFFSYHSTPNDSERNIEVRRDRTDQWLKALGIDTPFEIIYDPVRVDNLTVGENGIGFGDKFRGSSFFHTFARSRNALTPEELKNKPRRKLYLSRTKLGPRKGQVIGEAALERTFIEAGYEPYWPEQHTMEEQLETYRTAEAIVGVEGSAFHLPPFSCPEDCRIAIISRRSEIEQLQEEFGEQIRGFTGIEPFFTHDVVANWGLPGTNNTHMETLCVIDFDKTYEKLIFEGFLKFTDTRHHPTMIDLCEHIQTASMGHLNHMHIVGLDREIQVMTRQRDARRAQVARQREIAEAKAAREAAAAKPPAPDAKQDAPKTSASVVDSIGKLVRHDPSDDIEQDPQQVIQAPARD